MNPDEEIRLRRLVETPRQDPGPSCPAPTEWASLAAGVTPSEQCGALLDHASGCDACGPLLRELTEDFREETTAEEAEIVESLRTATLGGQRELARKLAEKSRRRPGAWTAWMMKAAAVVLGVGAAWFSYERFRTPEPEALIAQAYTEQRPFDLRFRDAEFAPLRAERGVGSRLDRPQALLAAEARIAAELKSAPDSVRWLALRARAEMLNRDEEEAIATLQRALDRDGEHSRLLADLGMAYALRAESAKRSSDYQYAIEYLGRALKADASDAAALFNRAMVFERTAQYDLAVEDWQRYLAMDSQSGWAGEARRRLTQIEEKKKQDKTP